MIETVEDILSDMKETARMYLAGGNDSTSVFELLSVYHDRIESAYKRDLQAMVDAGECDMRTAMDEVTKLRKENARLKAALKPIIDFRPEIVGNYGEEEAWDPDGMMEAMVESQRIYNGGEA